MDGAPEISAAIANDICDLVDTVFNSMKKTRAIDALGLVAEQYEEATVNMLAMQDSVDILADEIASNIPRSGNASNNMVKAFADYGVTYLSMIHKMRNEVGMVINMRYRLNEARMEAEQNLPHKFVVERAVPPEKKAYPNKSLIVIVSTFASLLFALIVLIVADSIKARMAAMKEE